MYNRAQCECSVNVDVNVGWLVRLTAAAIWCLLDSLLYFISGPHLEYCCPGKVFLCFASSYGSACARTQAGRWHEPSTLRSACRPDREREADIPTQRRRPRDLDFQIRIRAEESTQAGRQPARSTLRRTTDPFPGHLDERASCQARVRSARTMLRRERMAP